MKYSNFALRVAAGAVFAIGACGVANASPYDVTLPSPGAYFGSGNPSDHWAVTKNNSVELGLRAQGRYSSSPAVTPDVGTNIYHVQTGQFGSGWCPTCAVWNFDFSVNLTGSGLTLGDVTSNINILNVGNGISFNFDPFSTFSDNAALDSLGGTRNGGNLVAPAGTSDVGFQNSENLAFGFVPGAFGFDAAANNTYVVTLSLLKNIDSSNLGSLSETIIAGTGATPLPATLPLFASGLGLMGFMARRRKRKSAAALAVA